MTSPVYTRHVLLRIKFGFPLLQLFSLSANNLDRVDTVLVAAHDICLGRHHIFCRGGCCLVLADRGGSMQVAIFHFSRALSPPRPRLRQGTQYNGDCKPRKEICDSEGQEEDLLYLVSRTTSKVGLSFGGFFSLCAVLWVGFK